MYVHIHSFIHSGRVRAYVHMQLYSTRIREGVEFEGLVRITTYKMARSGFGGQQYDDKS